LKFYRTRHQKGSGPAVSHETDGDGCGGTTERRQTMSETTARQRITAAVMAWPGVAAEYGERGEYSFRYEGREIGHLHGDRVAHFGFPKELGAELREAGRVMPHPVAPSSVKLAARRIDGEADEAEVVALMRLNYDRVVARLQERAAATAAQAAD
jgi:hypothetical protein